MIASLAAEMSSVSAIVKVTVEEVVLLPCNVKVKVSAPVICCILTLDIAVAVTPVVLDTRLNAAATSLASAPASTLAVFVPKEPFSV